MVIKGVHDVMIVAEGVVCGLQQIQMPISTELVEAQALNYGLQIVAQLEVL